MFSYPEFSVSHTKEETLAFIEYLMNKKDNLSVKSLVLEPTTGPCKYFPKFDPSQFVDQMVPILHDSPNALKVYEKFASSRAKLNSNYKLVEGFDKIYLEDEIEYLVAHNFSEGEASTWAKMVNHHAFIGTSELNDPRFPAEYKVWAVTNGTRLYSRDIWFECFADEYINFLHRFSKTDETKFTVTEQGTGGAYNRYGHECNRLIDGSVRECAHVVIGFHNSSVLDKDKMIALAESICEIAGIDEVWVKEIDENKAVVVRRER